MAKLQMKLKIMIDYLKSFKNQNYIFIMTKKSIFWKPKDQWKALRPLGLPSRTSSWEVNTLKIKNTVEHNINSIAEDVRNYYSTLAKKCVKMIPKPTNGCSVNTVIKYKHMNLGDYFHLASVLENSILF